MSCMRREGASCHESVDSRSNWVGGAEHLGASCHTSGDHSGHRPNWAPLAPSSQLENPVAQRLELLLPEVLTWGVDAVICALGTTSGKAGSKEAFRQVDYVLPLAFAKLAHQQGAEAIALVSAIGADANSSFFYPKTKGEVERDMKLVGFKSLTILRPSIIGGKRDESRFAEGLALALSRILAPVLPKKFHVNPAAKIAGVLFASAIV